MFWETVLVASFGPVNKVMVEPNKRTISHTVREIFIQLFVIFYMAILNLSLKSDGVRVKGSLLRSRY